MRKKSAYARLALLLVLAALVAGCGSGASGQSGSAVPEGVNPDPSKGPGEYALPAEPDLTTPEAAVASYLDWVSFAYRMANSDVATQTFSAFEEVRINAYVELNRQQNRGIDQEVVSLEFREIISDEGTATVAATEEWEYRYFSLDSIEWQSDINEASYETTYTVVRQPDGRWLVDSVEAEPLTEVP